MSYLQRRISFLLDQLENDRVVFVGDFLQTADGKQLIEEVSHIKRFSDGSVDLSTCSPMVRSAARSLHSFNRITELEQRKQKTYRISTPETLSKKMQEYFQLLDEFFLQATGIPAAKFAVNETFGERVRRDARKIAKRAFSAYQDYIPKIGEFHSDNTSLLLGASKAIGGLRCVMGGTSRFPEPAFDGLRKFALYADTIFVPDPVLPWIEVPREEEQFSQVNLLQETFNLLKLKPLIDAKLPYPAVVVFPSWEKRLEMSDEETQEVVY